MTCVPEIESCPATAEFSKVPNIFVVTGPTIPIICSKVKLISVPTESYTIIRVCSISKLTFVYIEVNFCGPDVFVGMGKVCIEVKFRLFEFLCGILICVGIYIFKHIC